MADDLIAEAVIKISGLCVNGGLDDWWNVQYDGNDAGAIHFKATWEPSGDAADLADKSRELENLKVEMER